jgi:hypothetical protein
VSERGELVAKRLVDDERADRTPRVTAAVREVLPDDHEGGPSEELIDRREAARRAFYRRQARTVKRVFAVYVLGLITGFVPSRRDACEIVSHLEGETGDRGSVERTVWDWLRRSAGSRLGHGDVPDGGRQVP